MRYTDEKRYFVSEATVYRLLKAHDLITSPAFVVIKAADEFRDKTRHPAHWLLDMMRRPKPAIPLSAPIMPIVERAGNDGFREAVRDRGTTEIKVGS